MAKKINMAAWKTPPAKNGKAKTFEGLALVEYYIEKNELTRAADALGRFQYNTIIRPLLNNCELEFHALGEIL